MAWAPNGWELIVILIIGILLFGRRLPEVGRWIGRTVVEVTDPEKEQNWHLFWAVVAIVGLAVCGVLWFVWRANRSPVRQGGSP